ncbi:MAG: polysaccharide deacetylase family protein [Peptostreptococcaceae bacterium]
MKKYLVFLLIFNLFISYSCAEEEIFFNTGNKNRKSVALTFDDGPHPKETLEILDILKKYDIKATFFVTGKHVNWYREPLLRAIEEGHEIANHTFSHSNIGELSSSQIEEELLKCEDALKEIGAKKPTLFRPPFGNYNKDTLECIAIKYGYKIILWATTFDVMDWKNPSASEIAQTIINESQNGDIILLHDYGTKNTPEALEILIPQMIEKGFNFEIVSDIIKEEKEDVQIEKIIN